MNYLNAKMNIIMMISAKHSKESLMKPKEQI